jgi:hypothetical protein
MNINTNSLDRRNKTHDERNTLQGGISKLRELHHKLRFCNNYTKPAIKLLNRSIESLENYLEIKGVSKKRMDTIFQEALEE